MHRIKLELVVGGFGSFADRLLAETRTRPKRRGESTRPRPILRALHVEVSTCDVRVEREERAA